MKVIILHGWGHNRKLWQSLANKFEEAEALNLPGFGNEPLVKDDWGVPEYADWVQQKIQKYQNIILIGHSFGGRIAAEISARNPKWLRGIVLSGAPCLYRPSFSIKLKIKLYKLFKKLLPISLGSTFYSKDLKDSTKTGLEKIFRKTVAYDQTTQLKKVTVPTLLIWGKNDTDVPLRIAYEMQSFIPQSKFKIIENAGHNSYLEKPDLFYGYVKNFINNISSS